MPTSAGAGSRAALPSAKVQVPRVPNRVLTRSRLMELLPFDGRAEPGDSPAVVLVCAPAGYGKTMLLADWAQRAAAAGMPIAWVSLDRDDNDHFVLWSAILRALEAASGDLSDLRDLSPPHDPAERGFLIEVGHLIESAHEDVTLVLDDVHELRDRATLASLDVLVRRMPARLRLVLASRTEPPLSLHRLRLDGELAEVRGDDLVFTAGEAEAMLAVEDINLAPEDLLSLLDRTEGWPAAVRIAAGSLRGSSTPSEIISGIHGDDRELSDYLFAEVLERQPRDLLDFLLATCVPERLNADLARQLSNRPDAGAVLDDLERRNTLIVRLGQKDPWYRYHALMRGYLTAEVRRRDPDAFLAQHATAATWLESHGAPSEALAHAAAARDPGLLRSMVNRQGLPLLLAGQGSLLRRHVYGYDEAMADPGVAVLLALAAVDAGDAAAADRCLRQVGPESFDDDRGRVLHAVARVARALLGADVSEALDLLAATAAGATGDLDLDLAALANRGPALVRVGEFTSAAADIERALDLAGQAGHDQLVLMLLSRRAGASGALADFPGMRRWTSEAIDFATGRGWAYSPRVAYAYLVASWAAFQTGDEPAMRHWAELGQEAVVGISDVGIEIGVLSMVALVDYESGDRRGAFERLRHQWSRPETTQMSPALFAFAAPQEVRMALELGEYAKATEVAERLAQVLGDCAETRVLRATIHEGRRRRDDARRLLDPVLGGAVTAYVPSTLASAWILEAALAAATDDAFRAFDALGKAVEWAAPNEAIRPFLDAPAGIREVLAGNAGRFGRWNDFVGTLLQRLPATSAGTQLSPAVQGELLTARELDLLRDLPSMMSVEEIASARGITSNTVKSHLRHLYRKLGVNTRRDAVARARERGLL